MIINEPRISVLRVTAFFSPHPLPPLPLFYAEFLQANFDFPISGRDLHPLYARGLASSTRTHSSLQQYISLVFLSFCPIFSVSFLLAIYVLLPFRFFSVQDVFFTALRTSLEKDSLTTSFSFAKWILTRTGTHTFQSPRRPGCK